jgi:hypothetical protein
VAVPTGGLIDVDYAKSAVGWTATDPIKDALLARWIQAATPIIERICGPVLPATVTKRFSGGKSAILLPVKLTDETRVTAVIEDGLTTTDYWVDADAGILYAGGHGSARTFGAGIKNVQVTYRVGFDSVPETIQLATRELVRLWVQQGVSSDRPSFDDDGQSDSVTVPQGFAVPRKIRELLGPYERPAGFA